YLEEYKASLVVQAKEDVFPGAPAPTADAPKLPEREDGEGEESASYSNWNQARKVELFREAGKSLGISIVGGRGMGSRLSNGEVMRGIFIKHILADSPAGRNGTLKTGDRIVEVDGMDLRDASHEEAVESIRKAGNPVSFLVQSIVHRPRLSVHRDSSHSSGSASLRTNQPCLAHARPQATAGELRTHRTSRRAPPSPPWPSLHILINCLHNSAHAAVLWWSVTLLRHGTQLVSPTTKRKKKKNENKKMEEEKRRWWRKRRRRTSRITQRYGGLPGALHMLQLEKGRAGLGLSLAGNRDRSRMSVFVVGIDPEGAAGRDGTMGVGDELLEINGQKLYGHSHQNASSIIKSSPSKVYSLLRNTAGPARLTFSSNEILPPCSSSPSSSSSSSPPCPTPAAMVTSQSQSQGLSDDAPSMPCSGLDAMDQPEAEELISSSPSRPSTPGTLASDPATCPIIPGCETTIDISKGRTGLGL
ncbi:hypothetical protein CRUP_007233, partial [Coryphaenoides rupestris]